MSAIQKSDILQKIYDIDFYISKSWRECKSPSLMTGIGGGLLFYAMMYKLTDNSEYLLKTEEVIEYLFDWINQKSLIITYSSGLIGLAYLFDFLHEKK